MHIRTRHTTERLFDRIACIVEITLPLGAGSFHDDLLKYIRALGEDVVKRTIIYNPMIIKCF